MTLSGERLISRRHFVGGMLALPAIAAYQTRAIPALVPRTPDGAQFVQYADCCSGRPGTPLEKNFASVNAVIARLAPQPEFIVFPGDHIYGGTPDMDELRRQWRYWLETEMAWIRGRNIPIYHTTSNHNTYSVASEDVFRETFPDLPRNGPTGQEGLAYWIRRGPVLIVCANTNYSGTGGHGYVEHEWLDRVLASHVDARFKFVSAHVPAFPLNGYGAYPIWRIEPRQADAFWSVLVKHRVTAYLCSHVLAFDAQVRKGVLQLTSGGAGTSSGSFPGGLMPGRTEYFHAVQLAVDSQGLRYQVLDTEGTAREWAEWPLALPPAAGWQPLTAKVLADAGPGRKRQPRDQWACAWEFTGTVPQAVSDPQTMLAGFSSSEPAAALRVMLAGEPPCLRVELQPTSGASAESWRGPQFRPGEPFSFQLALAPMLGPGGVLWRLTERHPWTSLDTESAKGAENLVWPPTWVIGRGHFGPDHDVWRGGEIRLRWSGLVLLHAP